MNVLLYICTFIITHIKKNAAAIVYAVLPHAVYYNDQIEIQNAKCDDKFVQIPFKKTSSSIDFYGHLKIVADEEVHLVEKFTITLFF